MVCTSLQNKSLEQILSILSGDVVEMAEIRLDLCPLLSDADIDTLFSTSPVPLIATCRISDKLTASESEDKLARAIKAGANFADLEIEAPADMAERLAECCKMYGCRYIRSVHYFDGTPSADVLESITKQCYATGADVAKIVTYAHCSEDVERTEALYSKFTKGYISAFCMGAAGKQSRMDALKLGAPFTYASLNEAEATADGQWTAAEMNAVLYAEAKGWSGRDVVIPASKSMAQRAIIAASLASGTSVLSGYSPCGDSESALNFASAFGADVKKETTVEIKGGNTALDSEIFVGESGFLTRFTMPIIALLHDGESVIKGEKSLVGRPLKGAKEIMAAFGVVLESLNSEMADVSVPLRIKGKLTPACVTISGKGGSQLISGLMASLPLCDADSKITIVEPRSVPYLVMTIDVLKQFGISIDYEICSDKIELSIKGGQQYKPANIELEADWSGAAPMFIAGAIFSGVTLKHLQMDSTQADKLIIDILKLSGVRVLSEGSDMRVVKTPIHAFSADLNQAPDLFPVVSVLAAFCEGETKLDGVGRLDSKESDRAKAIIDMLTQMGVACSISGDTLIIQGHSISYRYANGVLPKGGEFTSSKDHRMVMALKIAECGSNGAIIIDNEECVSKSFPEFNRYF